MGFGQLEIIKWCIGTGTFGWKFGDIMLTVQTSPSFSWTCSLALCCPFLLLHSPASSPMLPLIFFNLFLQFLCTQEGVKCRVYCLLAVIWMSFTDHSFFIFFSFLQLRKCEKIQVTTDILSIRLSLNRVFFCCFLSSAEQAENGKHTVHLKSQDLWKRGGENCRKHTSETWVQCMRETSKHENCVWLVSCCCSVVSLSS